MNKNAYIPSRVDAGYELRDLINSLSKEFKEEVSIQIVQVILDNMDMDDDTLHELVRLVESCNSQNALEYLLERLNENTYSVAKVIFYLGAEKMSLSEDVRLTLSKAITSISSQQFRNEEWSARGFIVRSAGYLGDDKALKFLVSIADASDGVHEELSKSSHPLATKYFIDSIARPNNEWERMRIFKALASKNQLIAVEGLFALY